ncbi:MAG: hypothetical protein WAT66_04770 [Actinomycetota bacterium]
MTPTPSPTIIESVNVTLEAFRIGIPVLAVLAAAWLSGRLSLRAALRGAEQGAQHQAALAVAVSARVRAEQRQEDALLPLLEALAVAHRAIRAFDHDEGRYPANYGVVSGLSKVTRAWNDHTIIDPILRQLYDKAQLGSKRHEWASLQGRGRSERLNELGEEIRRDVSLLREHVRGIVDPLSQRPEEQSFDE